MSNLESRQSTWENLNNLNIPDFSKNERRNIQSQLKPGRWKEVGLKIAINDKWNIEITKEERDGFYLWKDSMDDALSILMQKWRVYIYWWMGDEHEWAGFRIVPVDKSIINPYDKEQEAIDIKLEEKHNWINNRRAQIKSLINMLLWEDAILEERNKKTQQFNWDIPKQILAWKTVDEILQQIDDIL